MTDNSMPNVTNFVHDLVAMAKATEELPRVQRALEGETQHANRLAQTVQEREEAIMRYKAEIEALRLTVKKAEAERDDAELRFLEADEKASKVLNLVRGMQSALGETVVTLEPPKPVEPEPMIGQAHEPVLDSQVGMNNHVPQPMGQGEPLPTPVHADPIGTGTESVTYTSETAVPYATPLPPAPSYTVNPTDGTEAGSSGMSEVPKVDTSTDKGQSEPFPSSPSPSQDSSSSGQAESVQSLDSQPKAAPYSGVKYWHQGRYISRADWLAGGGTNDDYDWHPSAL